MKRACSLFGCLLLLPAAHPQGRPIDWPSQAGDAQRTGWEKVDSRITKDNVKDFRLVLKRKLENAQPGQYSLAPPVVIGQLISYRGFKELAFVASSSNDIWAIDADMDRIFWQKHFAADVSGSCTGGAVTPALIPPINFAARPRPATPTTPVPSPRPMGRGNLGSAAFGGARPVFALATDGKLHLLNTSTGDDIMPPVPFLPSNSKASYLTFVQNVVYAASSSDCGEAGVWALDLGTPDPQPAASYRLDAGTRAGGLALGNDNTVYVQTGGANAALLALSPKDLKLKQSFSLPAGDTANLAAPVVFTYKGRDVIATAGPDGRIYLLDSKSLGGDDQKTPISQSPAVAAQGGHIGRGLSTWQDSDGTRWILVPIWGAVNSEAPNGSLVAYKVEEKDNKTVLTRAWVSRDMKSPETPVITEGGIFVLSAGDAHATLYALDAATGKEIYSTRDQVTAPANLTGLTLANGRIFFTTTDDTLYAFGVYLER